MSGTKAVRIALEPLGQTIEVAPGTPLQQVLFAHGVEFPCGGHGRCRGCRVQVLKGHLPVTPAEAEILKPEELAAGWRLACRATVESDVTLALAQWDTVILADDTRFAFTPRDGLGVAVDLGTTTLVAQLLDLRDGHVLGVRSALNPQARHGADIMSRVSFGLNAEGRQTLRDLVRAEIFSLIRALLSAAHLSPRRMNSPLQGRSGDGEGAALADIVVVGNTVMHHLFCDISILPISHYPFEPENDGLQVFKARELGWNLPGDPRVSFLPCLGGFVGSDILAGILATGLHASPVLGALVDLGTNGELVLGDRERLICASTAAGPAFEGARISMGMRAATGAIAEVTLEHGAFKCLTLGRAPARGICGSGLVDAAAVALDLKLIKPSGRFTNGHTALQLCPAVSLTQSDIRELQLAKSAIAAGFAILLENLRAARSDVSKLYLAGAFGNYINRASALRIGLLDFPLERIQPAGNTALRGAKMALFASPEERAYRELRARTTHITLSHDPHFQDVYVDEMTFGKADC